MLIQSSMKSVPMSSIVRFLACLSLSLLSLLSFAQCGTGKTEVTLNWDYLDYFRYSTTYATGYLASLSQAQTQHFSFGTQRLTISNNYAGTNILGDTTAHTGDAG